MLYIFFSQVVLFLFYNLFIWISILFIFAIVLILYFKNKYKKEISKYRYDFFVKKIKLLKNPAFSSREKILEYDKIYHNILLEVGYKGTFGDILKSKPIVIDSLNSIWELHKLRNKIAHDMNDISENILEKKSSDYEKEIYSLLKKLS